MAYKFQLGTANLSGSISPTDDGAFDLGASGKEFNDLYIDGTAYLDAIDFNGTAISATAAEINKLDGTDADVTAAKLNTLCDLTNAEIGYLDGAGALNNSNAIKVALLDASNNLTIAGNLTVQGTTTTVDTTNLQVKDKNILINDGGGAATADGAGLDIEEGGSVAGFIKVSGSRSEWHLKAPNSSTLTIDMDADGEIEFGAAKKLTVGGNFNIDGDISSTAAEINLVDGSSAGTIVNSKAVIYGSSGEVNATTLQIAGSSITATAAELNLLDGITRGSILVGGSGGSAELDAKTSGQVLIGDGTDLASVAISGDIALAANGAVTIQANAVEGSMLNNNVISGQTDIGAAVVATDEILISDGGTLRRTDVSRLKTYIQSGVNVYKLSGSGTIDGIIAAASGSGFYYNDAAGSEENGLPFESKYMISGSNWTVGAELKIKAPALDTGGQISIFAQSSSAGDFIHSIDGIQSDTSGSNMAELGTDGTDIPAIVLESDNAAVTLVLYDEVTEDGLTSYQWAIM